MRRPDSVMHARWPELCRSDEFSGRWIALENVEYEPETRKPQEADVVDCDADLGELCNRIRRADRHSCVILLCERDEARCRGR